MLSTGIESAALLAGLLAELLAGLLAELLAELVTEERTIQNEVHEEKSIVWVKAKIKCEVEYSMLTDNGTLRDPVFKKLIN